MEDRPHKGDLLVVTESLPVDFLVHWRAPLTTGGRGTLPEGTECQILDEPLPEATVLACRPVNYDEVELTLVPESDRSTSGYDGFTVLLPLTDRGSTFELKPEPRLTLDEAYRAAFHFIHQYYEREPITPFFLMLHSMTMWPDAENLRDTADPATWFDWLKSVDKARESTTLAITVDPPDPNLRAT